MVVDSKRRPGLSFKQIARIAGWASVPPFLVGFGDRVASRRFPILVTKARHADALCEGLNHRLGNQTTAPRFGHLPADGFTLAERLDLKTSIRKAQEGLIEGDAANVVYSVTREAEVMLAVLADMPDRPNVLSLGTDEEATAEHIVFVRFFPGLRASCPLDAFVTMPDCEVEAALQAFAENWASTNKDVILDWIRKQTRRVSLTPRRVEEPVEWFAKTWTPDMIAISASQAIEAGEQVQPEIAAPIAGGQIDPAGNAKAEEVAPLKRRGAKAKYDPKEAEKIANAWATGRFRDTYDLAADLGLTHRYVALALGRHRKRIKLARRRQ